MNITDDALDDLIVHEELYTIVYQGDLYKELDERLKSLPDVDKNLRYFYQRDNQSFTLLMLSALYGYVDIVRVILSHSSHPRNLVELSGNVTGIDGSVVSNATALWCACDRGHYTVARILLDEGNASVRHGPKNPLLIDAVLNDRLDTIQFLVENGYADVNSTRQRDLPNYNSLILAAARGQIKIIAYLLGKGAEIDYKTRVNDTALGCAAMYGHLDTVKFLCSAGASTNIKNHNGETPLILAFENGHTAIVDYLLDLTNNELSVEDLELVACSFIVSPHNAPNDPGQYLKMVNLMEKIFQMRKLKNFPKSIAKPLLAYNYHQECQTLEEFEQIRHDNNRLYIEALLIRERILLPKKIPALCETLLNYGQKLVEQDKYEQCLYLWEHTFYLYQQMEHETSLHRFVWIFCKMLTNNIFISPKLFLQICQLTFQPAEQHKKSHSIKNSLCLITIASKVLEQPALTKSDRHSIYQWITDLCRQQRTTPDGQTLLHLCVNEQTYRDINYRANEIKQVLDFPNLATAKLLLTYGNRWINVDAVDTSSGNTPLHIVSQSSRPDALAIVELLINVRAHVDCLNKHNKTPFDYAKTPEIINLLSKYQKPLLLKCLCAREIIAKKINYELIWPVETKLTSFIRLHGRLEKDN